MAESVNSGLWVVGVVLGLLASIMSNLGVNFQKYSFMKEALRPKANMRDHWGQPLWIFGLFLVIFGSFADFVALGFAPQCLVAPVGSFTLVANVFFAHFWLKEPLLTKDIYATIAIVFGASFSSYFADKSSKSYGLEKLITLYTRLPFICYAIMIFMVCTVFGILASRIQKIRESHGASSEKYKNVEKLHPFLYASLSGIWGANSVLFAKSFAELIKYSVKGENEFTNPITYVIVVAMLTTIFMQLHWMAAGLKYFDALYIVPVFQCFFITFSIIGGALYFDEFSNFGVLEAIMFPFGVFITLTGVYFLSQREMNQFSLTRRFKKAGRAAQFVTKVQKLIAVKNKKLDTNGRYSELSESTQFEGKEDMNKSLDYVKDELSEEEIKAYVASHSAPRIRKDSSFVSFPIGMFGTMSMELSEEWNQHNIARDENFEVDLRKANVEKV